MNTIKKSKLEKKLRKKLGKIKELASGIEALLHGATLLNGGDCPNCGRPYTSDDYEEGSPESGSKCILCRTERPEA